MSENSSLELETLKMQKMCISSGIKLHAKQVYVSVAAQLVFVLVSNDIANCNYILF